MAARCAGVAEATMRVVLDGAGGPDGDKVVGLLTVTGIIRAQARTLVS